MKTIKLISFLLLFLLGETFAGETYVAVLETISPEEAVNREARLYLTDMLRERANLVLPAYMGFTIMTRENINAMLPPGKTIEDCVGECLAETGRNIAANYVAQARVGRLGSQLTLTVELYETKYNKLLGSFTARKPDADGLVSVIEKQSDALFLKIQSDVNNGFVQNKKTSMIRVNISTEPQGALLSVDGKPLKSCKKTPCDVELPIGSHRLSLVLDEYFDKDTVYEIESSTRNFILKMKPNFGVLEIAPVLVENVGRKSDLQIEIDGTAKTGNSFRLSIGSHKVKLLHPCYEKVIFDVGLESGSYVTFDRKLKPINAGLSLSVAAGGKPLEVPVFSGKSMLGMTPFLGTLPACAEVQIDYEGRRQSVGVDLKPGEYVGYLYDVNNGGHFVARERAE